MAYSWLVLFFLFILFLGIFIASKKPAVAFFVIIVGIGIVFGGGYYLNIFLNQKLRPNTIVLTKVKQLNFTDSLIVEGVLQNISKKDFGICRIHVKVIKKEKNKYKKLLNYIKPLAKRTIILKDKITSQEKLNFKTSFDGFAFEKDVNVSVNGECYK